MTFTENLALGLAGLTVTGIGLAILAAPRAFYASYGIPLGDDPNLLSELRAPAAGLACFGALMLAGIWRRTMAPLSKSVALTVFLAFPAGRLLGIAVDGPPSGAILAALALELAIAGLCLIAFRRAPARLSAQE